MSYIYLEYIIGVISILYCIYRNFLYESDCLDGFLL